MSPVDDTFISGSLDKTIRLWDLRSPNCQVRYQINVHTLCAVFSVRRMQNGCMFAHGEKKSKLAAGGKKIRLAVNLHLSVVLSCLSVPYRSYRSTVCSSH